MNEKGRFASARRVFRFVSWYGNFVILVAVMVGFAVDGVFIFSILLVKREELFPAIVGTVGASGFLCLVIYLAMADRASFIVVDKERIALYKDSRTVKVDQKLSDIKSVREFYLRDTLSYEILFNNGDQIKFGSDIPDAGALVSILTEYLETPSSSMRK